MSMGLTSTLNIAQSALATNAAQTSVVSRNISGANDPNYSRKTGNQITNASGTASIVSIGQATDSALFANLLTANATAGASSAVANGLDQLESTVSITGSTTSTTGSTAATDVSAATAIGNLASALQTYAGDPSQDTLGEAVVSDAQTLASGLNSASATVQSVREQADAAIGTAVSSVNSLLTQFQTVNTAIIKDTASGNDTTDEVDTRNGILQQISQQMGITTLDNANGGLSIYTDSGVTLFQGTARTVAFTPTATFTAGTVGGTVSVDGVAVTGSSSAMPLQGGAIAGLAQLRDTTTVAYQNQLDQIAQGLVSSFAESDQTGGTAPTIPGLFTAPGASATATTATAGLAASITVNPNVDTTQGGSVTLLRDGGIGDPTNAAYTANTTGAASYSDHLTALLSSLDSTRSFDSSSGGDASGSLASYASSSVSWLEASRQGATDTSTNRAAVVTATTTSLSSATGVNIDDELSKMLDLEHSYQASAELMQTVSSMFTSLFAAVQ
jgi:flagellar hook-associated protein 1 FlgK